MHCNGHCHLKKEMAKDENRANLPGNSLKSSLDVSLYSQDINLFHFSPLQKTQCDFFAPAEGFSSAHLNTVFHPPTVS